VNGELALAEGKITKTLAGKFINCVIFTNYESIRIYQCMKFVIRLFVSGAYIVIVKIYEAKAKLFNFLRIQFNLKSTKITFDYRIEFFNRVPWIFTETIFFQEHPETFRTGSSKLLEPIQSRIGH